MENNLAGIAIFSRFNAIAIFLFYRTKTRPFHSNLPNHEEASSQEDGESSSRCHPGHTFPATHKNSLQVQVRVQSAVRIDVRLKKHRDQTLMKRSPFPLLLFCRQASHYEDDYGELFERKVEKNHRLVTEDSNGKIYDEFEIPFEGFGHVSAISCSGHGLVCLKGDKPEVFVGNPGCHELMELPKPSSSSVLKKEFFALSIMPSVYEFRLIHLYYISYDGFEISHTLCEIFDIRSDGQSGSGSWRVIDEWFPYPYPWLLDVVENVDGAIYWWLKQQPRSSQSSGKFEKVVSLDLEKEEFLMINKPQECSGSCFSLVGLNGNSSLTKVIRDGSILNVDVWVLKDPGNSLSGKDYSISLASFPRSLLVYRFLPLHVGEREIMFKTSFHEGVLGISYCDMETKNVAEGYRYASSPPRWPLHLL